MPLKTSCLRNQILCFIFLIFLLPACKEKRSPRIIDRAFYYWKSSFTPGSLEQNALANLNVNRLYLKFFDVGWNESKSEPMPVAILTFPKEQVLSSYQMVPTVFITNDCMTKVKEPQVYGLAEKILLLINNICTVNNFKTSEIQLDCDWNESTKDKYFLLLQTIKNSLAKEQKILSATIRLYQYKYFNKAGIPPVDRGLLMCYNMGNLKNPDTKNSILEPADLKRYLNGVSVYPLPLDIALPIFSWKVLFRNNKYVGLINELPTQLLKNSPAITQSGNKFHVVKPVSFNGYNFESGDMLRDEEISYNELIKAEGLLIEKIRTQHFSVVLYHLDSITLAKFSTHELETVFDYLH